MNNQSENQNTEANSANRGVYIVVGLAAAIFVLILLSELGMF